MEVTCNDSVQCLVLFDATTEMPTWRRLFGGHLNGIAEPDERAATAPQATLCGKDLKECLQGMVADTSLAGRSIVLPHGGDENAHKTIIRRGFQSRFFLDFDGVYTDSSFSDLSEITKKKLWGEIREFGARRRGILPTGDNRQSNYSMLGKNECWIRLGEPTAEAIRQAVLADEARIAYSPPVIPTQRVLKLEVSSTLCGSNFGLTINDGFTALIGGRGAGKSAVLEYLRFGLGRSAVDLDRASGEEQTRERELVESTLATGYVVVTLERDGIVETWERSGTQPDRIQVRTAGVAAESISIAAAQERFRARGFYQKQLSTLVSRTGSAVEQITGIAAAENDQQRRRLEEDVLAAQREVQSGFQDVVKHWAAESEWLQASTSVSDLKRRLDAVKQKLAEGGLTKEAQETLAAAPKYALAQDLFVEARAAIQKDVVAITEVDKGLESLNVTAWTGLSDFGEVEGYVGVVGSLGSEVRAALKASAALLQTLEEELKTHSETFSARRLAFDARHAEASKQQSSLKALIEDAERLGRDLQGAEARERRAKLALDRLAGAKEKLEGARSSLTLVLSDLRDVLDLAARRVQGMSSQLLNAEVVSEPVPRQCVAALVEVCDGARVRDLQDKCEDRAKALAAGGAFDDNWAQACNRLVTIYRHKVQSGGTTELSDEITELIRTFTSFDGGLTPTQTKEIYGRLDDGRVARCLTAHSEDFIQFKYKDRGDYIPFVQASPGQQAAALLNLLLLQEAGTLIIDQPEDDLDNKVIKDIVKVIQTTKRRRQLIFATHNPNFVVNGDADKVVALSPSKPSEPQSAARINVEVDGAIETHAVRSAITDTMEGGKEAFELRGRKYQYQFRP